MPAETTFLAGHDLSIIEGEDTIVLRKGFLHVNEVSIDKDRSSRGFLELMRLLARDRSLTLSEDNEYHDDFMKLVRFRLIDMPSSAKFYVIADDAVHESLTELLDQPVFCASECFSKEFLSGDFDAIRAEQSVFAKRVGDSTHVYYLGLLENLSRLRSVNKLLFSLGDEYTIGFVDEGDVYVTGVRPRYSGCYECLEKKIISRFPGTFEDYLCNARKGDGARSSSPNAQLMMLASLVRTDQQNIAIYGSSSMTGSVAHYYLPNFEYSFEANRKDATCLVCSGINNARFEEQNARSINLVFGGQQ